MDFHRDSFSCGPQSSAPAFFADYAGNVYVGGNLTVVGEIQNEGAATQFFASNGTASNPSYTFESQQNLGFFLESTTMLGLSIGGAQCFDWGAQQSSMYAVFTSLSNYERLGFDYGLTTPGQYSILSQAVGAGSFHGLQIGIGGNKPTKRFDTSTGYMFDSNGALWAYPDVNGNLSPQVDNAKSIGDSTHRASNVFSVLGTFSGNVTLNGNSPTLTLGGTPTVNTGSFVNFIGSNTATNWLVSANNINAGAMEFTPSTAGGGSTFTTPALILTSASNATFSGNLTTKGGTILTTSTALTNNAAAQVATMTNGPTAGNPTKWIPINDNGTTRNIPCW